MDVSVARVLNHEPDEHDSLAALVAALADETQLWELMSHYNWDDGFAVPLSVVRHPRCDRGLALRLFWELDDSAQEFHADETADLGASYAPYDPEEAVRVNDYCRTLIDGLRNEQFPFGRNSFDTGFFGMDDPTLTERQRTLRVSKTKFAQRDYDDGMIRPVVGSG